jgi:hypothetical protein
MAETGAKLWLFTAGKYSLGEMILSDIPLEPTLLEEQRA